METFRVIFSDLPDPRDCTAQHDLTEIVFVALAASLCGAQICAEMAEFGVAKAPPLRGFLTLEHGIPSHDTFSRVFRRLGPQAFAEVFRRFMEAFGAAARPAAPSGVVAISVGLWTSAGGHARPLPVQTVLSTKAHPVLPPRFDRRRIVSRGVV